MRTGGWTAGDRAIGGGWDWVGAAGAGFKKLSMEASRSP
jgi:hypothetical protein